MQQTGRPANMHQLHNLDLPCFCPPQVRTSEQTPLISCLLEGPPGTGKTALAATVGIESDFPFVKVISAESMVGYSEASKSSQIAKIFDDAYRVRACLGGAVSELLDMHTGWHG